MIRNSFSKGRSQSWSMKRKATSKIWPFCQLNWKGIVKSIPMRKFLEQTKAFCWSPLHWMSSSIPWASASARRMTWRSRSFTKSWDRTCRSRSSLNLTTKESQNFRRPTHLLRRIIKRASKKSSFSTGNTQSSSWITSKSGINGKREKTNTKRKYKPSTWK